MEHRTDMDSLIPVLERICREHRAMSRILREDNPRWRDPVRRLCDGQPIRDAVHNQFRAVRENQLSSPANEIDIGMLLAALDKTNLL